MMLSGRFVVTCPVCKSRRGMAHAVVRIAHRQAPSRVAFKPGIFEAKLVAEDGCEYGTARGETREQAWARAVKLAEKRGLHVDAGRVGWLHIDGWPTAEDLP